MDEKLFNDLFLDSHRGLAIKCLQTLNNFNNFLVVESQFGIDVAEISDYAILRDNKEYQKRYKTQYGYELITPKINKDILYNYVKQSWIVYNNKLLKCSCSAHHNTLYIKFNIN